MLVNRETSPSVISLRYRPVIRAGISFALVIALAVISACGSDATAVDAADAVDSSETAAETSDDAAETTADATTDDAAEAAVDAEPETVERPDPPTDVEVPEFDDRKKPVVPFTGEALSELETEDVIVGEGAEAVSGSFVDVHYVGVLNSTGEQFDASWDRGSPFSFGLGGGQVIAGWDEGRRRHARGRPSDSAHSRGHGVRRWRQRHHHSWF